MENINAREERRESVGKIKDDDEKLNFINFVVPV